MGGLLARQAFSSLAQPGTRTALAHINEWLFLCWIGCLPSSQAATSASRRPLTSAGSLPCARPHPAHKNSSTSSSGEDSFVQQQGRRRKKKRASGSVPNHIPWRSSPSSARLRWPPPPRRRPSPPACPAVVLYAQLCFSFQLGSHEINSVDLP